VFVESYGAVTFTNAAFAARIDPARARLAERLGAAGFHAVSNMIRSPITGGGSWLAHTSLMAGVRIDEQPAFDVLMTTRFHALAHDFAAAGYRTIAVQPRINEAWPEGRFFGFEDIFIGPDMGYGGPRYTWESVPDQYVLHWVEQRVIAPARGPIFAMVILASSHTPFDRVPPVISDWMSLGRGDPYRAAPGQNFPVRGAQIFTNDEGYLACLEYDLDVLGRFIGERIRDDTLIIVLGDHQPPLIAARETQDRSVPIYAISRNASRLAPFRQRGYVEGLRPARMNADAAMEDFLERFVADFSRGPPTGSTRTGSTETGSTRR